MFLVERSPILCAFSHSLFFLFRFSILTLTSYCLSKKCLRQQSPQQPTNRIKKKRFPGEGETLLANPPSLSLSLSLSSWSERKKRMRRDGPPTTNQPWFRRPSDTNRRENHEHTYAILLFECSHTTTKERKTRTATHLCRKKRATNRDNKRLTDRPWFYHAFALVCMCVRR